MCLQERVTQENGRLPWLILGHKMDNDLMMCLNQIHSIVQKQPAMTCTNRGKNHSSVMFVCCEDPTCENEGLKAHLVVMTGHMPNSSICSSTQYYANLGSLFHKWLLALSLSMR
jgi:hypothetical protein